MKRTPPAQQLLPLPVAEPGEAYRRIRNYLAGRLVGATRDEALVEEVVNCVFCKALLTRTEEQLPHDPLDLARRYRSAFAELKLLLPALFEHDSEILLDPTAIQFVDAQLAAIDFESPDGDPIGDVYEAFVGSAVRGSEGQFFTPRNAVRLLVDLVDPQPGERILDPACGAGGFLNYTARHLMAAGMPGDEAAKHVYGIDKDHYLTRLAAAHVGLVTLAPPNVYCADSLAWEAANGSDFALSDAVGTFDVILTNPPFGSRIVAASEAVQRQFELGYKWVRSQEGPYRKTDQPKSSVPPQVLFVERCLSLVRPGGRIGIVVPESLISGKSYRHVVQFIRDRADVRAVIGMPETLFKTSGKGGTHTKTCLVLLQKRAEANGGRAVRIFMAETQWCGHDSRGKAIDRDELPLVLEQYQEFLAGRSNGHSHLGYALSGEELSDNVLAPRYYDPDVASELDRLSKTHDLVSVSALVSSGLLEITTGDEVGKLAYDTDGKIPFVRTSDLSNWEIKIDPKHYVSEDAYKSLAPKQDVREGDILMVRDGTYLIGTCAYITEYDTQIIFQSHIYKIRVTNHAKLSPFLLLAILGSPPVRRQIKAKRFTQDIIDSLGDRIYELVLPIPKSRDARTHVHEMVARVIRDRVEARELARRASLEVVGHSNDEPESDFV